MLRINYITAHTTEGSGRWWEGAKKGAQQGPHAASIFPLLDIYTLDIVHLH